MEFFKSLNDELDFQFYIRSIKNYQARLRYSKIDDSNDRRLIGTEPL